MTFFLATDPPTTTAQEHRVSMVHGRPRFYDSPAIRSAKLELMALLHPHRPLVPLQGAVQLEVIWLFPKGKSHQNEEWKTSRPDTDNLEKLLKDCMTQCGFWKDDAQVVREIVEKRWSDTPGIHITVKSLEADS